MAITLPEDFLMLFRLAFGEAMLDNYLEQLKLPAYRGLRLNPMRHMPSDWAMGQPVPFESFASYIESNDRIGNDPLHAAGNFYLQEPSAMAPARVLHPQAHECVLDLCAAPGGKTTQIATLMNDQGFLLANDISATRAEALVSNIERFGLQSVAVTCATPAKLSQTYLEFFDAILVDAPCSGEGMFRKDAEAITFWRFDHVEKLHSEQVDILDQAYRMLRHGGRIVYSTCTINPIENELTLAAFLARHPDMSLCPIDLSQSMPGHNVETLTRIAMHHKAFSRYFEAYRDTLSTMPSSSMRRLLPTEFNGEGHFIALLQKAHKGAATDQIMNPIRQISKKNNQNKPVDHQQWTIFSQFCAKNFTPAWLARLQHTHHFSRQKDTLYAVNKALIELPTYFRKGIPLISFSHKEIKPEHALAMTLREEDCLRVVRLPYGDDRALRYLEGHPITDDHITDGYCLITLAGNPLGFGKASQGTIKNHYPKGLRRTYAYARLDETP
nr:hypothetical protein [Bacilli bacterium]